MPKGNSRYDTEHLRNVSSYLRQIDEIFKAADEEAAGIAKASGAEYDPDRPFSFDDYPSVRERVDRMTSDLASRVERTIVNGIKAQWELSNRKNDDLVETVTGLKADDLPSDQRRRWFGTNESARDEFIKREREGMNLSEEVWRFRRETEFGIDLSLKSFQEKIENGLSEGVSAADMSRELRDYLKHPDKLFRRVRDERGNLTLSRNARLFHPGQGVYRSSYMNARRLAATETNMAYRSADHERWRELDFVVGIEIRTSNNHTTKDSKGKPQPLEDICDELAGRYPKDFKFVGWHPHCRCIATTILKTEEEMAADNERILNGEGPLPPSSSANYEGDLPKNFTEWLTKNETRIADAKSLPYFLKDNRKLIEEGGAKATASTTATPTTQTEQQEQRGVDYTQENAAIEEYVGGEGMWVNQYLRGRGDFGQLSEEEMRLIEELTDITSRETVGVQTLYRSVNADAIFGDMSDFSYEYLKEHYIYGVDNPVIMQKIQRYLGIEGKQVTEKGFMSTTRDREIVENWGDYTGSEHPVVMVIRTDGTTKGFDVERYMKLHHPEIEADDPQSEILLSRGQRFEVEKVYGKDGNIVVEVKLLPEKNAVTYGGDSEPKKTAQQIAEERHANRTDAQINLIHDAWTDREVKLANDVLATAKSCGEVDYSKLEKAIADKNVEGMQEQIKAVNGEIKRIDSLLESNMKDVEKNLNIKKGKEMTFEEADESRGNPNYSGGEDKYRKNCQCSVVANEVRRRGCDVEARPNEGKGTPYDLSHHTEMAWVDSSGHTPSSSRASAITTDSSGNQTTSKSVMLNNLNDLTSEQGRYHISWIWSGSVTSGHIITAERLPSGEIRYYDPQSGRIIDDFSAYADRINLWGGIDVLRVDRLRLNTGIISGAVRRSGQ